MNKIIFIIILLSMLLFTGCAKKHGISSVKADQIPSSDEQPNNSPVNTPTEIINTPQPSVTGKINIVHDTSSGEGTRLSSAPVQKTVSNSIPSASPEVIKPSTDPSLALTPSPVPLPAFSPYYITDWPEVDIPEDKIMLISISVDTS